MRACVYIYIYIYIKSESNFLHVLFTNVFMFKPVCHILIIYNWWFLFVIYMHILRPTCNGVWIHVLHFMHIIVTIPSCYYCTLYYLVFCCVYIKNNVSTSLYLCTLFLHIEILFCFRLHAQFCVQSPLRGLRIFRYFYGRAFWRGTFLKKYSIYKYYLVSKYQKYGALYFADNRVSL